jgi:hypothetical protein
MKINRSTIHWVLLSLIIFSCTAASFGQIAVGVSVRFGPPAIPVYAQPICPGPGYFWTPGYWAWNDAGGYYWVPGTWVIAPVGMLWTPGYWGWGGGFYAWHPGYWGPHIGFYGGINYGFGYTGVGFVGGEWRGGAFYYNRSVTNVSVTNVTNVYNRTVVVNESHVSYNGGEGGVNARASAQEERYAHEQHNPALSSQLEHERGASENHQNFASENHGRPSIAATSRPGDFSSRSAVPARNAGGEYHAPAMSPKEARVGSTPNRSDGGFRPFTPPSKSGSQANQRGGNSNAGSQNRSFENRSNENRNRGNEPRVNESRPQNESHSPQPRQSAPKSSPPPRKQSPPKEERHRGR